MALVPLNPHLHSLTSHPTPRGHSIPHAPWTPIHPSSSGNPSHHSEDTAPLLRYPSTPYPISLCSKEHSLPSPYPVSQPRSPPGRVPLLAMKAAMSTGCWSTWRCRMHPTKCRLRIGKLSGSVGTPPSSSGPVRSSDLQSPQSP